MKPKFREKIPEGTFDMLINDFWEYMSRASFPPARTRALWFDKISSHYEDDIEQAFDHMKDHLDRVPYNIPKAIKASVAIVIAGKAGGFQWIDYGECDDCGKSGFFSVRWFHNKHKCWYQGIRYCAACENWRNYCNEPGERATSLSLQEDKFKFKPGNKCLIVSPRNAVGHGSVDKIHNISRGIFKPIPKSKLHKNWQNMDETERKNYLTKYA